MINEYIQNKGEEKAKREKKTYRKTELRRRLRRSMIGSRWRSAASKDNDVKHEDHRYRIGLANGTKDIQLMIPYVTRRVFTRRLVTLLARPPPLTISRPLCFTSATPKWTAEYPFVRSIFFHSTREGRGARRRRILVGRILPSPRVWDTPTVSAVGVICGESVTFFYLLSLELSSQHPPPSTCNPFFLIVVLRKLPRLS